MVKIEAHVSVESASDSAAALLREATGLSIQRIKFAMAQGAVWITRGSKTQRLRRVKRVLRKGDELHIYYDSEILALTPPAPDLVADVGGYSVWNKPGGLLSQGSKWGDHCTIVRWAERHLKPQRPAFTVHRLDRAASGLIIVAHSKSMAASLSEIFRSRRIEKRYRATVAGDFSDKANPLVVDTPIDGKQALSNCTLLEVDLQTRQSLLEVGIETGRKHQIRRHLADIGHPIIGDRMYGSGQMDGVDLQLTAFLLAFECPLSGQRVEYQL